MTTKEIRDRMFANGRDLLQMTPDEPAEMLLAMREELYDNQFIMTPAQMSIFTDIAWALSSPDRRKQWENDAQATIDKLAAEPIK